MNRRFSKDHLAAAFLSLILLGVGAWLFVREVSTLLWDNSIRTITESTHQGANALNIQFETDFNKLKSIGETITASEPDMLEDLLSLYRDTEPDVTVWADRIGIPHEDPENDALLSTFLEQTPLKSGIVDAHINSVTGENVFNLFVTLPLSDGTDLHVVKEYRTKEIADQFTLTFYDNSGFSYLISQDGAIQVRAGHKNSNKTIRNLFDMISKGENDPQTMAQFKKSIYERRSGWATFTYGQRGMVFCYEPLRADSTWLLISIIPEAVILRQTNSVLLKTLLFSGTILLIAAIFYINKMRENRKHTRELQEALDAADRANHVKGDFLMNMSHDIRTPLNAIIGMTAIAQENIPDHVKMEDCLKKIKISGTYLLSLVSDVLDMSQIEDGKIALKEEPILLPQLYREVTDAMSLQTQEAGLDLEALPAQLKNEAIQGDPLRIRQVLLNIITNAIKYTPSGGRVSLGFIQKEDTAEGLGTYQFQCRDTGIGMSEEFLTRIFLPFERNKNTTTSKVAGAGVGLSITKGLLDLMGGEIFIESELEKGSTFTVYFYLELLEDMPQTAKETPQENAAGLSEEIPDSGDDDYGDKRILLVEDNELNMEIAEELIGMTGVQIETACDGQVALQMVRDHPCGYYDLIFMDIQMPVMDGYEATRQIRKLDREDARTIPIYAMSANAFAEDVENSIRSGMNGHIAKPIDMDPIEKVMQKHLR
ncbi:MAG: response regulator [Lachnospiraceae bacterium]|nr:response regulator [Lachnospiraceae bacterium]